MIDRHVGGAAVRWRSKLMSHKPKFSVRSEWCGVTLARVAARSAIHTLASRRRPNASFSPLNRTSQLLLLANYRAVSGIFMRVVMRKSFRVRRTKRPAAITYRTVLKKRSGTRRPDRVYPNPREEGANRKKKRSKSSTSLICSSRPRQLSITAFPFYCRHFRL